MSLGRSAPREKRSGLLSPAELLDLLIAEFTDPLRAAYLCGGFLKHQTYRRHFASRLLGVAKGEAGDSWEVRRLATLMLEHEVLKVPAADLAEFDFWLTRLNLKPAGTNVTISESVLKEGYTTTALRGFVAEFRRKLGRWSHIHDRIQGPRTAPGALLDFIKLSRRDCQLALARYVFRPEEVVSRILEQVRLARGIADLDPFQPAHVSAEAEHSLAQLPDFEGRILRGLREVAKVFWVSESTSAELNSLVEYPLGTVVLVIKPPGSHLEFEIKRAGRRGRHPLGVVYLRGGRLVPRSHRLDGGAMQTALRWEAEMAAKFSAIYQLAHGVAAPFSRSISRISVNNLPAEGGEARLLNYFTEARVFGTGFREMRAALAGVVASFDAGRGAHAVKVPGELGLTARFLMHVAPSQALFTGTSSFRLERLAAYLSAAGPKLYFGEGLKVAYSTEDARRLADEVLAEVLGVYRPPSVSFRSYGQYLTAAFAVAENRERANRNFLAALGQVGTAWGTLVAVRGSSSGESFVPRNVGLRSVWEGGQWGIKVIFMDHDSLQLSDPEEKNYQWLGAIAEMAVDETFILGLRRGDRRVVGEVDCLETIYRVGSGIARQGRVAFREAMEQAYRQTHRELEVNPALQRFFHPSFVRRLRDLDLVAARYVKVRHDPQGVGAWREEMTALLGERGYRRNEIAGHLAVVEKHAEFLERYW